ncbi:hypothetical protein EVAR_90716_1 [Eumeta japonica]|uniref:Uncharacterized protein n=1 Tax=Eumeta variegata TaxID=151549 RepID=A0A4C1ZDK9_EUMVA|nr:hypothetical protein EVAR_90716_1 [Eumeta japonica]
MEIDKRVTYRQIRTSSGIEMNKVYKIFYQYLVVRKLCTRCGSRESSDGAPTASAHDYHDTETPIRPLTAVNVVKADRPLFAQLPLDPSDGGGCYCAGRTAAAAISRRQRHGKHGRYRAVTARWSKRDYGSEATRFDPDHGRIGQCVFNLSRRKPHVSCLGEHVRPSAAVEVTALVMTVLNNPRSSLRRRGNLKAHPQEIADSHIHQGVRNVKTTDTTSLSGPLSCNGQRAMKASLKQPQTTTDRHA